MSDNPFAKKVQEKKALRPFGAKKKRKIKVGDVVRISNAVLPPYGDGKTRVVRGTVDAIYEDMHYFVVMRDGTRRQYTTPGTFKMKAVG